MTVAWISFFPIEWLPDIPEELRRLPRMHPATWQRVLLAELKKIPSLRLHIIVLRKQFERDYTFERNGVVFHLLKTRAGMRAPSLFWHDTLLVKRVLRNIRPDVVHAWGTENGAALVASRLGCPYVVTMQGLMNWLAELLPVNRHQRFAAVIERWSLKRAALVTAESVFAQRYLNEKFPHLTVEQVEHAPDQLFSQVERRPQLSPRRFLFVSSLAYAKGGDVLLRALDQMTLELPFELVVVGRTGEAELQALRATVSPELWRRLRFKAELTSAEVARELASAALMIYPTRADNSPNAVKEAAVAGVPVVASAIGGIVDYVFPGENGWLFTPGDVNDCARAIQAACRHPLLGQGRVEPASLVRTREYLSAERMGRKFFETYRRLAVSKDG